MYLQTIREKFMSLNYPITPCTADDIMELEGRVGFSLPAAYKEFLTWMGRRSGGFMIGTDFGYTELLGANEAAIELLNESQSMETLPEDAIIILFHQGYTFDFIRATEGDDPPVYSYSETKNEDRFVKLSSHYSEYLLDLMEKHLEYVGKYGPRSEI